MIRTRPWLVALSVLSAGCLHNPPPQTVVAPAGAACLVSQNLMVRDALSFGLSIPGGGTVSDSAWDAFLAEAVTPAFPTGFTVLEAKGQWREESGLIAREPSRVLVVLHAPKAEADSTLGAIRQSYMKRFSQEAVMWERTAGCVSF